MENNNDSLIDELLSNHSKKSNRSNASSKKSKSKSPNKQIEMHRGSDVNSEDISISQLEMMANRKKINKKNLENSDRYSEKYNMDNNSYKASSIGSSTKSEDLRKYREKEINRENRSEHIRKQKNELLYKLSKINIKGKWSSLKLDMNCSLEEIRNEYERVRNAIESERSVSFFKRMLLLGVQGIEMLNTKFDPVGVDLDGWSESMGYSVENQEYDDVMAELCEKYKGAGEMAPELKLVFMIISSATMFTISKKIAKMDSTNGFANMIGNMVGSQAQTQQYHQSVPQNSFQIPRAEQLGNYQHSESSDDNMPSKINGPDDGINIENILKTMNERRRQQEVADAASEDVFKSIPIAKKKTGRRKKVQQQIQLDL